MIGSGRLKITLNLMVGVFYIMGTATFIPQVPSFTSLCEIQGNGFSSALIGEPVSVQGVVTLDLDQAWQRGFYIQQPECDADPSTSDGLYVYLGVQVQVVNQGDWVEVNGTVNEYYGLTEIVALPDNVTLISTGHVMPVPASLNPPFDEVAARVYFESIEGMLASLDQASVIGPTDADDRSWVVNADLGIERVFYNDPAGTGEIICVDDGGSYEISPEVKVGDHVNNLEGVIDYRGGLYCLALNAEPVVEANVVERQDYQEQSTTLDMAFTLGTFNLANLFDMDDDPEREDEVLGPTEYQRRLHKRALAIQMLGQPDILAVQEAENLLVLQELVSQPEITESYGILIEDGPDNRGLDVALLYNTSKLAVIDYQVHQGCTTLVDGLGPDGNGDVLYPANAVTCDTDGDGSLDGNRLFSRPPLLAQLLVCAEGCTSTSQLLPSEDDLIIWLIVNHWKSKFQDTSEIEYTSPRRVEQAGFVGAIADTILSDDPGAHVIVIGDLNDHPDSLPLDTLRSHGLEDRLSLLDPSDRYTYLYQGLSQVLDHFLIHPQASIGPVQITPVHVNADYPYMYLSITESVHRSSDHDPFVVSFTSYSQAIFLPLVSR